MTILLDESLSVSDLCSSGMILEYATGTVPLCNTTHQCMYSAVYVSPGLCTKTSSGSRLKARVQSLPVCTCGIYGLHLGHMRYREPPAEHMQATLAYVYKHTRLPSSGTLCTSHNAHLESTHSRHVVRLYIKADVAKCLTVARWRKVDWLTGSLL